MKNLTFTNLDYSVGLCFGLSIAAFLSRGWPEVNMGWVGIFFSALSVVLLLRKRFLMKNAQAKSSDPLEFNKEKILQNRVRRNEWFLKSFDVLNDQEKRKFSGLLYYPYDTNYLKVCEIQKFKNDDKAIFTVEGHGQIELRKYGFVSTKVQGQEVTLNLYCDLQTENPTEFFAPFKDKTNGKTTYGGGRNLDVQLVDGKALIDFNDATNLGCAYSEESVCALPLAENWLTLPIEAGEMVFTKP